MSEPVETPEPVDIPGPDHRAETKSNAFWRTFLQVGPAAALALLLILPSVLQSIIDDFGDQLPPGLYAVLVAITGGITLTAAIAAKLMARPDVQEWTAKYLPFFAQRKK